MIRSCRDCGRDSDEDPDDPAPALCPTCYGKRMAKVYAGFEIACDTRKDPLAAIAWLASAFHDIGGETLPFAAQHASEIMQAVLDSYLPD